MKIEKFKEAQTLLKRLEVNKEDFKKLNLLKNERVKFIHVGYKDYDQTLLIRNGLVQSAILGFIETKLLEEKESIETEFTKL